MTDSKHLAKLFPPTFRGWSRGEPDGFYDRETIYELIDGGAEVYLALNLQVTLSRRYVKAGAPEIIADLFDMGSPADAFGAFRHDMREGEEVGVGRASELEGTNLAFWKDRYFVSLVALAESKEIVSMLKDLGKEIAGRIEADGPPPSLVRRVPEAGLDKNQLHYFHDKMLLDRHFDMGKENLLALDMKTEGLLARYKGKAKKPSLLLLVRYPDRKKAKKAFDRFTSVCLPAGTAKNRQGRWGGASLDGDLFIGVFEAPSRGEVERLIDEVLKSSKPGDEGEEE
jgi:hypothetical protein